MDTQGKLLRAGAAAIIGACMLRLLAPIWNAGGVWSVIAFLQTGRFVTQQPEVATEPVCATEPEAAQPVFSPEDAALIQLNNTSGYAVDIPSLLTMPLSWQQVTVLILHTHGTESYTKTENYKESSLYRTTDTGYNVVSVGDRLAALLESKGIRVIHDRTMYDAPSYDNAYIAARSGMQAALAAEPSICLVLDLHRDATMDHSGSVVTTGKGASAQLMFVMGTDAGGYTHPAWQSNLSAALKLQALLETICPGICRPTQLRSARYNQDLSPGAMLVEVGFTGNTRQEALLSAEFLAEAIYMLAQSCT